MPASNAHQAEVAHRRAKLIRLRRQAVPFDDPRIVNDLGYSSAGAARKDLIRALESNRDDEAAEASVYRQQENERLDALLAAVWPQATEKRPIIGKDGEYVGEGVDIRAVDTVLRLIDRRAKLNGLDMPAAVEVSGPGGGALRLDAVNLAQLNELIATAGDPDGAEGEDEEDLTGGYAPEDEDDDDDV
ncbi:hypothetical protein ACH4TP_38095 [Streptomyces sp. NPDC021012]|uniref:hypothetical protein n=1 Tax=Streptomyces sp. NPDC021012 TaxID=3365107 RepID=UPI0037B66EEC